MNLSQLTGVLVFVAALSLPLMASAIPASNTQPTQATAEEGQQVNPIRLAYGTNAEGGA